MLQKGRQECLGFTPSRWLVGLNPDVGAHPAVRSALAKLLRLPGHAWGVAAPDVEAGQAVEGAQGRQALEGCVTAVEAE